MVSTALSYLLFTSLFSALVAFAGAKTTFHLATALSLASLVNGAPIHLAAMILLDGTPIPTFAATEVTTLVAGSVDHTLFVRSDSTSTEQTNATDAGNQPTQSMEDDNNSAANNGSISHSTIVAVIVCVVLFFTMLISIYLWRRFYPPRPGQIANPPDGDLYPMTLVVSSSSTVPLVHHQVVLPQSAYVIPGRSPTH